MDKFFAVMVNGKHTQKVVTVQDFIDRGYTVNPSRRFGKFDVFSGINKVATLFDNQADAVTYLAMVEGK